MSTIALKVHVAVIVDDERAYNNKCFPGCFAEIQVTVLFCKTMTIAMVLYILF